jgi:serine/threonine-protein kinase HipA
MSSISSGASRRQAPVVDSLLVVLYGQEVGTLTADARTEASFTYSPSYLDRRVRPPLSMRMPLQAKPFTAARTVPFLEGLLPENRDTRREKARALGIRDDPMSLLAVMGWDCPGAVQIASPDQLEEMFGRAGGLEPVSDREIGHRIARLRDHTADWTLPDEHWSLAGQQEKFALAQLLTGDGRRKGWAEAKGSAPTTHIVKPGIGRLHHQALVEHATMRAAAALGVEVARTDYAEFGGQTALIVERFDRVQLSDGSVQRIHQEDLSQATGRLPENKYEDNGGPNAKDMAQILKAHAHDPARELRKLADFLLINYAAVAPDGHSKNVSIRILPNGDVRLAPLYDLATGLPYAKETVDRRLALSIGGERRIDRVHAAQWTRAARELGVPEDTLRQRARELLANFPDAFHDALDQVGTGEAGDVWHRAASRLEDHAATSLRRLETNASNGGPMIRKSRRGTATNTTTVGDR